MISELSNPKVIQFIQEHLDSDPVELVLKAKNYPEIPVKAVAAQIASRKKIVSKLPEWYSNPQIIFPPKENLEQASSEKTAKFKSRWVSGNSLLDLTGGSGVDSYYLSQRFSDTTYVEPDYQLFELAEHNFNTLNTSILCINDSAESFLESPSKKYDVIYLDPSRRNNKSKKVFGIEEYQPNAIELFDVLLKKGKTLLIKASPMLDIKSTLVKMPGTSKVQVVAVSNEVKEILFFIDKGFSGKTQIEAWNLNKDNEELFSFTHEDEIRSKSNYHAPLTFIYEPNSSIRKAGAFNLIGEKFKLYKLHPNTHLYTSDEIIEGFPGKVFRIKNIVKPNKKEVLKLVPDKKINVISKNYALGANELKKNYQMKDGGEEFLIFCECIQIGKICMHCEKL
ncbi:MAG: class I SAM-dependent methyltransferase [Balneola sp.]|nr:MAG: class I SAM-dependent methyltransferase [Balneola sp.]